MTKDTEVTDVEMTEHVEETGETEKNIDASVKNPNKKANKKNNAKDKSTGNKTKGNSSLQSEKNKKAAQLMAKIEDKKEAKKRKIAEKKAFKQGVPLSGKWWKDGERKKFSSLKNKDLKVSRDLALIKVQRDERKFLLEHKKNMTAEKDAVREKKRETRKINQIRTLENQLKSEKLQIIKNPNTIKKMKRNQRKAIETRDLSTLGPQNLVK